MVQFLGLAKQFLGAVARSLDLVIAGIQKAGTSSLAQYLSQHPHILLHESREMPYFVRDKVYERDFDSVFREYYPENPTSQQLVLAKSVDVAYLETAARRLSEHSPNCRIIIILRDPADRAYSAYWYMRREGWETKEMFEAALAAEGRRIEKRGDVAIHCSYCTRGRYPEQISRLKRLFSPKNINVLLLRDLNEAPVATCQSVFDFVGVDQTFQPSADKNYNTAKKARSERTSQLLNRFFQKDHVIKKTLQSFVPGPLARKVRKRLQVWNQTNFSPPPMRKSTRQALAEYFEPHNQKLESMLGRSLNHWTRA